jgi:hypothetical protein
MNKFSFYMFSISVFLIIYCLIYGPSTMGYEYKLTVINDSTCKTQDVKIEMYGNTSCSVKDCANNGKIWSCKCNKAILTIASPLNETCNMMVYYYINDKPVSFPLTTTYKEESVIVDNKFYFDPAPFAAIGTLAIGVVIVVVSGVLFIHYAQKYIKKEIEEDEKRDIKKP